ncbi:MAG: hypothetical protein KVP17_004124 [Porospora cf. gigantea B]|uniref:uncharacterized protein n=1 Tax=Porospora cf. gigantea B TaxID=2853592 RepID=UPI003571B256|nr:MAG: hypothetical protein KVP17_004124 [Porospora cf. gigantea B]
MQLQAPVCNRYLLLGVYYVVLSTGFACVMSPDPIIQIVYSSRALPSFTGEERAFECRSLVSYALSSAVISGAFSGYVMEYCLGAKMAALVGYILSISGWMMLTNGQTSFVVAVGAISMGIAYQLLYCAHLKIGQLFPNSPGKVVTILCSAGDVSTGVPVLMQSIIRRFILTGSDSHAVTGVVVGGYMVTLTLAAVVDMFCVPWQAFQTTNSRNPIVKPLLLSKEKEETTSFVTQATSSEFILFTTVFTFLFWRAKKFLAVNIRPIFASIVPAENVNFAATLFNTASVAASVGTLLMGWLVDRFSLEVGLNVSVAQGTLLFAFALLPSAISVYCICLLYIPVSGFLFGLGSAFVGCRYGFENIGVLQGILSSVAGLAAMVSDVVLPHVEAFFDFDYRPLTLGTFILSVALLGVTLSIWHVPLLGATAPVTSVV